MSDKKTYSAYAVLCELNHREFRKKLDLYPAELRYYVVLANSIIGSENAKRVEETPEAVAEDGKEFVAKLLAMANPGRDDVFREVLETYLIETMKDELRYCCPNCANFNKCLDLENLSVGSLFERRVKGEDTATLKKEITLQVENALHNTPYIDTDRAHTLCRDFRHQYTASNIGEIFGRYSDIALGLQNAFGVDYKRIQKEMISANMQFSEKSRGLE
jgi:hypothetical protein